MIVGGRIFLSAAVLLQAVGLSACAAASDLDALFGGAASTDPLDFADFAKPAGASPTSRLMDGHLVLGGNQAASGFEALDDADGIADVPANQVNTLPAMDIWLVQSGDAIVPVVRGIVNAPHPYFDLVFSPGAVWQDDSGANRISLPFALMEKNANCIHNGVLTVRISGSGQATRALVQVASETCGYFKFNLWGSYDAAWAYAPPLGADGVRAAYVAEVAHRLPTAPIESLAGTDADVFAQSGTIASDNMTAFGVVHDGTHYVSGCDTRFGAYPFCDTMALPSYSVAKSLAAGIGLMRLEKLYQGLKDGALQRFVPQCTGSQWQDVTLEHLADMTTGNYISAEAHEDEGSTGYLPFFLAEISADKTDFSCRYFPRKSQPGERWVYHTSDTYLLGVAMNGFLKSRHGGGADYYRDLVAPLWRALHLGPLSQEIRRTSGANPEPFSGYGMLFYRDDIARIATDLAGRDARLETMLDTGLLDSAMQRDPSDSGSEAGSSTLRYNNAFWGWNAKDALGCTGDAWLPFFSGYGGITVVMLPGGRVYYYFSDGYNFTFSEPVKELAKVSPVCGVTE
ncbi:serine hydrolase domain-containing protein [Kordiimonas lacus]|uniref:Beta-lactamase n=1 Tax=Kordiimonas lacus TaxID=637679 RepID=A0A1G6SZP2_9PROT|nr:serine hydrolase domain-containing protein [Kordiimonas lacus]SDD21687.1 Beta-lactamase [Kordiimonas lacus]